MTRLGHGALMARRVPTDLADLLGRAQTDLAAPLSAFRVITDLPKDLPSVMVDPVLIGQSLVNLMENATKYAPEGSTIRLSAQLVDQGVAVLIEDEGPGIPRAERARVFDLFHRAIQGDGQPAGTGVGLAIVKGMVEANDGEVEAIEPPSGQGAAIRLFLPLASAHAEAEDG